MAITSGFAVLSKEPKFRQFNNGRVMAEVFAFLNDYAPGVGVVKKTATLVFWDEDANRIMRFAQNHTKKDGTPTGGKGMSIFFGGYAATDTFQGRNNEMVSIEKIHVFHFGFKKIPLFESTAVIGSALKPKTVNTKNGPMTVVEALVFFNGHFPVVKESSLNVFVSFWGEKAEWLLNKAQSHMKNNVPTGGKGMFVDLACTLYTHTYQNQNNEDVSFTKAIALDVKYTSSPFVNNNQSNNYQASRPSYNNNQQNGYQNNNNNYQNNNQQNGYQNNSYQSNNNNYQNQNNQNNQSNNNYQNNSNIQNEQPNIPSDFVNPTDEFNDLSSDNIGLNTHIDKDPFATPELELSTSSFNPANLEETSPSELELATVSESNSSSTNKIDTSNENADALSELQHWFDEFK